MAFTTGTFATYDELKTAVEAACVAAGWTLADDILSKGGAFVQLRVATPANPNYAQQGTGLAAFPGTGKSGTTLIGAPVWAPRLGPLTHPAQSFFRQLALPADYFIFTFSNPDEVFIVARWNGFYTRLCFGVSTIPGSGVWVDASVYGREGRGANGYNGAIIGATSGAGFHTPSSNVQYPCITGMWQSSVNGLYYGYAYSISIILSGGSWVSSNTVGLADWANAIEPIAPLLGCLQSGDFADPPLLPIRVHYAVTATTNKVVLEVENARYFRLKNHDAEAIIQRGGDRWMVFPWLKKNGAETGDVNVAEHSGTFGWAIRYDGP